MSTTSSANSLMRANWVLYDIDQSKTTKVNRVTVLYKFDVITKKLDRIDAKSVIPR